MAPLRLSREAYRDKVHGAWMGKLVGITLGTPLKGRTFSGALRFYDPVPGQATPCEDFDFQIVWLHALMEHGIDLSADHLSDEWRDHLIYNWDEAGWALWNLERGLTAPISGAYNNWFKTSSAGASRTEIWALIAPGAPQVAATYANHDSSIDHTAEGVWAAMFWAAIQSAAFFVTDLNLLFRIGLAMMPGTCRTARAVRSAQNAFVGRAGFLDARGQVIEAVGNENYTDVAQNVGFGVLALLYGQNDFGLTITNAANCGYDAGGNAGTVGALMGIMHGIHALPTGWTNPIGDAIIPGWGLKDLDIIRRMPQLVDFTTSIGEEVVRARCTDVELTDESAQFEPVAAPLNIPESEPLDKQMSDMAEKVALEVEVEKIEQAAASNRMQFLELDSPADSALATAVPPAAATAPESNAPAAVLKAEEPAVSSQPLLPTAETVPTSELDTVKEVVFEQPTVETTESLEAAPVELAPTDPTVVATTADEPIVPETPAIAVETPILPEAPPAEPPYNWTDNEQIKPLLVQSSTASIHHANGFELVAEYGTNGPAVMPGVAGSFTVTIKNNSGADFIGNIHVNVPDGWQVAVPDAQGQRQVLAEGRTARYGFVVRPPDNVDLPQKSPVSIVMSPDNGPAFTSEISFEAGTCWWWVGPLSNAFEEGYTKVFSVEDKPGFENDYLGRDKGLVKWQRRAFLENVMPLEDIFAGMPGVAYGVTTLTVDKATPVKLVFHANDGIRVWVNNELKIQQHSHTAFRPTLNNSATAVDVVLNPGANRIMVKVVRCAKPIQFSFAVIDPSGKPATGLGNTRW